MIFLTPDQSKRDLFKYLKMSLPYYLKANAAIRSEMQRKVEDLSLILEFETLYHSVPDVFAMIIKKDAPSAREGSNSPEKSWC
jgi:hypothetical protein